MKKRSIAFMLLLAAFRTDTASAEVLDKIVAVIDNRLIITQSDVRKERSIQTALGSKPGSDEALLESLIERHLVEEQIAQFREIEVSEDAVESRLREIGTVASVSSSDLRQAIAGEQRRGEYIIQRFRQFIQVSNEELLKYYEDVYVPELRRAGRPVPPVEQGLEDVRPNVIAEKLNREVSAWLEDLRGRILVEKITD